MCVYYQLWISKADAKYPVLSYIIIYKSIIVLLSKTFYLLIIPLTVCNLTDSENRQWDALDQLLCEVHSSNNEFFPLCYIIMSAIDLYLFAIPGVPSDQSRAQRVTSQDYHYRIYNRMCNSINPLRWKSKTFKLSTVPGAQVQPFQMKDRNQNFWPELCSQQQRWQNR